MARSGPVGGRLLAIATALRSRGIATALLGLTLLGCAERAAPEDAASRDRPVQAPAIGTPGDAPTPGSTDVATASEAAGDAGVDPDADVPLGGRLIFTRVQPGGRRIVQQLDAATGAQVELFALSESAEALAGSFIIAPDGDRLAYALSGPSGPSLLRVRALEPGAEPAVEHALPERASFSGLHWRPDGRALIAGLTFWAAESEGMPVPEAFEIWSFPAAPEGPAGSGMPERLYREAEPAGDLGLAYLAAWDEPNGSAALLDGPGESAYVSGIRVVDVASGQTVATWPTGGEGFRFAAGPRLGWPGARWLALVDERGWIDASSRDAPSYLRLVDLELPGEAKEPIPPRWMELAEVPPGMRAADLTWSAEGEVLAWSETPIDAGTGLRQRIRLVHIGGDIGPAVELPGAAGPGAIPLAFEPPAPDRWPRLLAGDGLYAVDRVVDDEEASEALRQALPWSVPTPAVEVYPRHGLSGLGEVLGWLADPGD